MALYLAISNIFRNSAFLKCWIRGLFFGSPSTRKKTRWLTVFCLFSLVTIGALGSAHAKQSTQNLDDLKGTSSAPEAVSSPSPSTGDTSAAREFASDEELVEIILEVRLHSFVLSDAMFAYLDRRGVLFFPLRDYVEMLDFPIKVDPEGRRAGGWFLNENRLFSLQLDKGEVIIKGQRIPFDRTLVRQIYGDLFVDTRLLAQWFPVDIDYDLANLLVNLTSREPLPLEQKLAREQRRARTLAHSSGKGNAFDRIDNPYAWLAWPTVDSSLEFALNGKGGGQTRSSLPQHDRHRRHREDAR